MGGSYWFPILVEGRACFFCGSCHLVVFSVVLAASVVFSAGRGDEPRRIFSFAAA